MMRKERVSLSLECKNRWKNIKYMACISYNNLWESDFDNIVSEKDRVQDLNINQLKLEVHDS